MSGGRSSRITSARRDFVGEVHQVVSSSFAGRYPNIQLVAGAIGMSTRTLQRRLGEDGVTYAQVVARAMQKYGILLADGGTIALTAQSDRFTTAKWSGLLDPLDLSALHVTDFEMVAGGQRYNYTGDCARTSPLFNDAFELGGTGKWGGVTP